MRRHGAAGDEDGKQQHPEVIQIAMKAQLRLHRKYWGLLGRGKQATVAVTAVARELLGFIWSIACYVESKGKVAA